MCRLKKAFTIVEIIVVIFILSIVSMIAIPMLSSAADTQVRSAANILAADIEYAKNLAISRQKNYSVVFDISNNTYEIHDNLAAIIDHPVTGKPYSVNFANESRLSRVVISSALFDSTNTLTFDYLGSPFNGSSNPLNSGEIILVADGYSMTIEVQAVTGYLTIN
ncbi:MAG: prepilin-type N-terminal cleavage/methylation domain-containing protein [Planctomycetes bacterium]|nr:prepilin-type N-terminal cleavage/methylation domain-containing protein [Planctomycetota bacterium]